MLDLYKRLAGQNRANGWHFITPRNSQVAACAECRNYHPATIRVKDAAATRDTGTTAPRIGSSQRALKLKVIGYIVLVTHWLYLA
jgi:hypothetical protein